LGFFGKLAGVTVFEPIALRSLRASPAEDESRLYELYAAVRAEELGMQGWEPELRARVLRQQCDAQRHGYRERYPNASRSCPVSVQWGEETLTLPLFPGLSDEEQAYVIRTVRERVYPLIQ